MSADNRAYISILLAIYEPNMDWLKEQLLSLNSQTYLNLRLYVREDCSPTIQFEDIVHLIKDCVTAFPFTVARNEKNLGSDLTFERLTQEAEGDIFAYCDQDDIWLPKKLETLQKDMERENALLVCSDMYVIDSEGKKIANCIRDVRSRHIMHSGSNLAKGLLTHNFVTGCAMLVDAKIAKEAIPFCPYMVHDHYLALYCAAHGRIYAEPEQTICYRQHGGNQTGVMSGVNDKLSYGRVRIEESIRKFVWLQDNFLCDAELSHHITRCLAWMLARQRYWTERRGARQLWHYRDCGRTVTIFELAAAYFPERLFLWAVELNRKNFI